ncbi:hypothetical protein CR513_32619, partial [Mucuna pruriens]
MLMLPMACPYVANKLQPKFEPCIYFLSLHNTFPPIQNHIQLHHLKSLQIMQPPILYHYLKTPLTFLLPPTYSLSQTTIESP